MLHELQRNFASVALKNVTAPLLPHIEGPAGSKERRLGVYHANTINSLIDVLSDAYPVTQRIIGERFFSTLAKSFIETAPPRQPTLFRYGSSLGDFLGDFAPAQDVPYLADIARLEWARIAAYFAEDYEPLNPQKLSAIGPEKIGDVCFKIAPSLHLVESPYPIFQVWAVNQPSCNTVPAIDFTNAEQGFVSRQANEVFQHAVTPGTFHWLRALSDGSTLGAATNDAMRHDQSFDLQNTLRQHLADGTFTTIYI